MRKARFLIGKLIQSTPLKWSLNWLVKFGGAVTSSAVDRASSDLKAPGLWLLVADSTSVLRLIILK